MMRLMKIVGAAVLAVCLCGSGTQAVDLVNIQFVTLPPGSGSAYSGAGPVVGSAGDKWNQINSGSPGGTPINFSNVALVDALNASTSITISGLGKGINGIGNAPSSGFDSTSYQSLMRSYLYSLTNSSTPSTFTISGLNNGALYDIYIMTQGDSGSTGRRLGVKIGNETQTSTPALATANSFTLGQNYLRFTNLSPSSGSINIDWWAATSEANINGIQIVTVSVPEPGTWVLAGVAVSALVAVRRRRCQAQAG